MRWPPNQVYENFVCLAHTDGGVLRIGVETDRTATGLNSERNWRSSERTRPSESWPLGVISTAL